MISEWLLRFTCQIGGNFNNAMGFENSQESNLLTGITLCWFCIVLLALIMVCILILYKLETRKEKNK